MVEPAHPAADLGPAPVDPVVEGAHPEKRGERPGVDRGHGRGPAARGRHHQAPPGDQRDEEGPLVGDAAQARLERAIRSSAAALASATRSVAARLARRRPARTAAVLGVRRPARGDRSRVGDAFLGALPSGHRGEPTRIRRPLRRSHSVTFTRTTLHLVLR